jgi:hypothetical protein
MLAGPGCRSKQLTPRSCFEMLGFVIKLISVFLFGIQTLAATPETPPACNRPGDFSIFKAVKEYETCLKKKRDFCDVHARLKECLEMQKQQSVALAVKKRFPSNPEDINPEERCVIGQNGRYVCTQDPIRLIAKEIPPIPQFTKPKDDAGDSQQAPVGSSSPSNPPTNPGAPTNAAPPVGPPPPGLPGMSPPPSSGSGSGTGSNL